MLHIFHFLNGHFARKDIAHGDEAIECVEEFSSLHPDPVDQLLALNRRAREPQRLEHRDLAAVQFDFASHG